MSKHPKVLTYDIETNLNKFLAFSTGKQVITHKQLFPRNQYTTLITIQYCWNDGKPGKIIIVDPLDPKKALMEFDKIANSADIIIGKNNCRFDDKHMATQRLIHDMDGRPDWLAKSDDLERQIRRYFYLQSYSLDYISELLGLGGKIKMEFDDWVDIFRYQEIIKIENAAGRKATKEVCNVLYGMSYTESVRRGKLASKKMYGYGARDAEHTRDIWEYASKHFTPKHNLSVFLDNGLSCTNCGSTKIKKNGTRVAGKTKYQQYYCNSHGGYAGRHPISQKKVTSLGV